MISTVVAVIAVAASCQGCPTPATANRRYSLFVSMQIRNLLNHNNPGSIIGSIASPLFGQANQPGLSLGGGTYVMVCPYDGASGSLRAEWFPGGLVLTGPRVPQGVLSQIVLTHDQDRQTDKLYLNGQLVASGVNTRSWTDLPDTDNWLARDQVTVNIVNVVTKSEKFFAKFFKVELPPPRNGPLV